MTESKLNFLGIIKLRDPFCPKIFLRKKRFKMKAVDGKTLGLESLSLKIRPHLFFGGGG